jgi:hypothetical protein
LSAPIGPAVVLLSTSDVTAYCDDDEEGDLVYREREVENKTGISGKIVNEADNGDDNNCYEGEYARIQLCRICNIGIRSEQNVVGELDGIARRVWDDDEEGGEEDSRKKFGCLKYFIQLRVVNISPSELRGKRNAHIDKLSSIEGKAEPNST